LVAVLGNFVIVT